MSSSYERHFSKVRETVCGKLGELAQQYPADAMRVSITGSAGLGLAQAAKLPFVQEAGDMRILQEFLEPMRTWVGYLGSIADPRTGLPVTGLGDWCSPSMRQAAESGTPWIGNAEIPILTSGMYIRCCRILAQTEELVGDPSRSQYYRQLADSLSRRLTERYFLPPHERAEYSQTALAFAYYYCDPALLPREKIVEKLVALCDEGRCFDAGIFGTAPMLHILAAEGLEFGLLESISKFDLWYFDKNPVCFTIS